ncbi:protein eva-1 homolog A isoform X2 [Ursus arctos]|uniref:protein eva-1 homolog A isoform X2 n=1 Tax=Ursus arctos TaxID=9644 RepID=UPI00254712CD|nr:protein eva-1 homolog A isoform X2 [Ursus arctos]
MGNLPGPWKGLEAPGGRQELESVNKLGVEGGATRRSRSASAGLGATSRKRRSQDPAPRASPGGSSTGISLRGVSAGPSPGRGFAASSPRRSAPGAPARPGAPRAQPPEVRAGGPGEEEKRGRCHLDPAEAFSGGFLWMPRRGRPSAIARNW